MLQRIEHPYAVFATNQTFDIFVHAVHANVFTTWESYAIGHSIPAILGKYWHTRADFFCKDKETPTIFMIFDTMKCDT